MAEAAAKEALEPPTKRIRTRTEESCDAVDSTTDQGPDDGQARPDSPDGVKDGEGLFNTFEDFEIIRVISNNEERKSVAVEGRLKDKEGTALVMLQKNPFNNSNLDNIFSGATSLKLLFQNDVYYNKIAMLPPHLNEIRATVIYPATEKHINKFEKQPSSFVEETPELYQAVTLPYVQDSAFGKQWIYNILEHKKEADRIVFEDSDTDLGFILLPDLKWTGEQNEDLYLQAIVHRRDLKSLRDLTAEHIPLLKNIYTKGTAAIWDKYGLAAHKQRVYLHYQPSYYHLHVHFTALSFEAPGIWPGKAHLLTAVISNLHTSGDHYQKAVLPFTVKDNHPLRQRYESAGYFSK